MDATTSTTLRSERHDAAVCGGSPSRTFRGHAASPSRPGVQVRACSRRGDMPPQSVQGLELPLEPERSRISTDATASRSETPSQTELIDRYARHRRVQLTNTSAGSSSRAAHGVPNRRPRPATRHDPRRALQDAPRRPAQAAPAHLRDARPQGAITLSSDPHPHRGSASSGCSSPAGTELTASILCEDLDHYGERELQHTSARRRAGPPHAAPTSMLQAYARRARHPPRARACAKRLKLSRHPAQRAT